MARIHVLSGGANTYNCVVHAPIPSGGNSSAVTWKLALANSGLQVASMLPTGTGPGQITTVEANQITNGDLLEAQFSFTDDAAWTDAQRQASLSALADVAIAQTQERLRDNLKFFGMTVA